MSNVAASAEALEQALKRGADHEIERCLETLATAISPVLAGLERLPAAPPLPGDVGPPDRSRLEPQVCELAELLRRQDMKAEDCFAELRVRLGAGACSAAMARLEQQLERLHFCRGQDNAGGGGGASGNGGIGPMKRQGASAEAASRPPSKEPTGPITHLETDHKFPDFVEKL